MILPCSEISGKTCAASGFFSEHVRSMSGWRRGCCSTGHFQEYQRSTYTKFVLQKKSRGFPFELSFGITPWFLFNLNYKQDSNQFDFIWQWNGRNAVECCGGSHCRFPQAIPRNAIHPTNKVFAQILRMRDDGFGHMLRFEFSIVLLGHMRKHNNRMGRCSVNSAAMFYACVVSFWHTIISPKFIAAHVAKCQTAPLLRQVEPSLSLIFGHGQLVSWCIAANVWCSYCPQAQPVEALA